LSNTVKDASFIKLDNVTVGYTLDKSILKSATLRFTAGVQNVLTLTKYNGLDPEKFNGIDNNVYPRARTFLFGVPISNKYTEKQILKINKMKISFKHISYFLLFILGINMTLISMYERLRCDAR
jgi:hypothetical protein